MLIACHGLPNTLHILYDDFNGDCYIVRSVSMRTDPPTCCTVEVCEYEKIKLKRKVLPPTRLLFQVELRR